MQQPPERAGERHLAPGWPQAQADPSGASPTPGTCLRLGAAGEDAARYTSAMSRTPDDLAELLVLLLADLAEEYGWPRLRVLRAVELLHGHHAGAVAGRA